MVITVINNDTKESKSLYFHEDSKLSEVRTKLQIKGLMKDSDFFLSAGSDFDRDSETEVTLEQFLDTGTTLVVGHDSGDLGPADPTRKVMNFKDLSPASQKALIDNIELTKGVTIDTDGMSRSLKKSIVSWDFSKLDSSKPVHVTKYESKFSFDKVTHELNTFGAESASANLTTPYGGGSASYEYEKSKITKSEKVTEHLVTRFLVQKEEIKMELENMTVSPDFVTAVRNAVEGNENSINGYQNLKEVLDDWGYYVPCQAMLGGALYSTESTEINEFSEANSEKEKFSASFNAAFDGIGGGGEYSKSQGYTQTDASSSKFTNISMDQLGGLPLAKDNGYDKWMESLDPAENWTAISYGEMIPSLALIFNEDEGLATNASNLLTEYCTYPAVRNDLKGMDMYNYGQLALGYNAHSIPF